MTVHVPEFPECGHEAEGPIGIPAPYGERKRSAQIGMLSLEPPKGNLPLWTFNVGTQRFAHLEEIASMRIPNPFPLARRGQRFLGELTNWLQENVAGLLILITPDKQTVIDQ